MSGKKRVKDPVRVRAGSMGGRPRMADSDRMVRAAEVWMRPGDLAKIQAVAERLGLPTSSPIRDLLLVLLEEPGAITRAVLAARRVELGHAEPGEGSGRERTRQRTPRPGLAGSDGRQLVR